LTSQTATLPVSDFAATGNHQLIIPLAARKRRNGPQGQRSLTNIPVTLANEEMVFIDENGGGAGVRLRNPPQLGKRK
jgi:hypothetical protein